MARVLFTNNLRRHVDCDECSADSGTLKSVLDEAFNGRDKLRSYVLDEHGRLRKHMAIFVDGKPITDRVRLTDPVSQSSEVYIMQALSGG